MKVRDQILVLLGLPVACQIVSACILAYSVAQVDEAARKEATAKKVMGLSQQTIGLVGQRIIDLTSQVFSPVKHYGVENETIMASLKEMENLVSDNPSAKEVVLHFTANLKRFLDAWEDIAKSIVPGRGKMYLAQLFDNQEMLESLDVAYRLLSEDGQKLKKIYGPIAEEFQPKAMKERMLLRTMVIGAIAFNIVLVVLLAVLVNQNTLSRLQVLMNNIRAFSQPKAKLHALSGNDELAELDKAFNEMAAERARLDEIRKSLMAMASHDLRSPLTSMSITLEYILEKHSDALSPDILKRLDRMSSEAHRLVRLSSTFLDIEKIESGRLEVEMKKVTLAEVVEPSIAAVRSLADVGNIQIVEDFNKTWTLSCDQERTIQVIVNLLSNAIKFSPRNESVSIKAVPGSEDGLLRIEIQDSGEGVPESERGLLFNKFSQLDQPSEIKKTGSGLGLYICKMLVTAQGGEIGFRPGDFAGSCFWFELPTLSKLT